MNRAKIIRSDVGFPADAALIAPVGMASDARYVFIRELKCDKKPCRAVMILCGSDCFDVFINGADVASYAVRSYAFCRAYEAYDVADFLNAGKNEIVVKYIDKKAPVFRGFVCEFIVDGKRQKLPFWFYDRDRSRTFVPRYISGGGAEICDLRRAPNMNSIRYGETFTEAAPLSLPVGSSLYQSKQKAQEKTEIFPGKTAFAAVDAPMGDVLTFDAKHGAVIFSEFSHSGVAVGVKNISGVNSVYIDGKTVEFQSEFALSEGKHLLAAVLSGGLCSFAISGGGLSSFKAVYAPEKTRPYIYPWNENTQKYKNDNTFVEIAKNTDGYCKIPNNAEEAFPIDCTWQNILSYDIEIKEKYISRGSFISLPPYEKMRVVNADFGRERVGFLKVNFETKRPIEVEFFTYELLSDGVPRKMGEKSCGKIITAEGKCEFTSERLRGFRYASLIFPACAEINDLSVSVVETKYPTSDAGAFSSNDKKLDEIYKMSVDTAAVCMLDAYVDCPGYEQNVWTGDAGVTGMINMTSFGDGEFDARYLDMTAQSMSAELRKYYRGSNPLYVNDTYLPCACFPTYPDGGIPIWSFTWVLHVLEHMKHFGLDDGYEARLSSVEECLRRAETQFSPRGLFAPCGAWNLVEWANNDLSPYGEASANNMMLHACYTNVSNVFSLLGDAKKSDEYSKKAAKLKEAINKYCWSDARCAYVDTVRDGDGYALYLDFCKFKSRAPESYETYLSAERVSVQTATFAILYDVADGERRAACEKILFDDVLRGDFRAGTPAKRTFGEPSEKEAPGGIVRIGTPFFMYYALGALFKIGKYGEALAAIRREWGQMLDDGLTTCVETFKNDCGEWGRSIAHAWSAAPAVYLKTEILGVKPVEPGYKKFTVEPHPCGLDHAEGVVPTPYGNIFVKWTVKRGKIKIKVDAPKACKRI